MAKPACMKKTMAPAITKSQDVKVVLLASWEACTFWMDISRPLAIHCTMALVSPPISSKQAT
jgi:hypothetical protein